MTQAGPGEFSLERMFRAVARVRERAARVASLLQNANIAYAMVGGQAVAAFVSSVNEAAVRNTPNVDVLVRRTDRTTVARALSEMDVGVHYVDEDPGAFRGPGRLREAVKVLFASERVRSGDLLANPDVSESHSGRAFRVVNLAALVRMKLVAYRTIDRVHLRDMVDVALLDAALGATLHPELSARLQHVIDTPDG
jgi:hypothetical protein